MILAKKWLYHPSMNALIYFDQSGKASYEIELTRVDESGTDSISEWIFHVLEKTWSGPMCIYGLVQALEYFYKKRRPREWRFFPRPAEESDDSDVGFKVLSTQELMSDDYDIRWAKESKKLAEFAIKSGAIR